MRRPGFVAFMSAVLLAGSPSYADDRLELGAMIFNGTGQPAGSVTIGNSQNLLPLARFPCRTCHGRDGAGGGEGNAPSILWRDLTAPSASRPAYSAESFARLLATGVKTDENRADALMPRYQLSDESMQALAAFLDALPRLQKRGIESDAIRLGVPVPADNPDTALEYAGLLTEALAEATQGQAIYNRRFVVEPLKGDARSIVAAAGERMAVVVGLVPSAQLASSDFIAVEVPVLFPLAPLVGGDPGLVRGIVPQKSDLIQDLLSEARERGYKRIGLAVAGAHTGDGLSAPSDGTEIVRFDAKDVVPPGVEAVVIAAGDGILSSLPPGLPVFAIGGELSPAVLRALQSRHPLVLANAYGHLGEARDGLLNNHARAAAALLVFAARTAGYDLNRAKLLLAFDRAVFSEFALNYADHPLSGTASATFVEIAPPRSLNDN